VNFVSGALGKYLANAIFGLFYFITAIFGPKITKKIAVMK
jgi:hypothetical protein